MDLIDVEALLENARELHEKTYNDLVALILNAPTVDAESVRHGKWLLETHKENVNYRWNVTAKCSECAYDIGEVWAGIFSGVPDDAARSICLVSAESVKLSNYCPYCGAKMDGVNIPNKQEHREIVLDYVAKRWRE